MTTAILPSYFMPIARREQLAARAAAQRTAPARFVGIQEGFGPIPAIELWNLTADIPGHCEGSTVARETILAAGYVLPSPMPFGASTVESSTAARPLQPRSSQ